MISVDEILKQVIEIQKKGRYSDKEMASRIGCSRPLYQRTRTGRIPVGGTFLRGAMRLIGADKGKERLATVSRKTRETDIALELNIDGSGHYRIQTGISILDHLLAQIARHGLFDITINATGDDPHHLVEDIAICLGRAFDQALGDRAGINRMADAIVPMDESLVMMAVDIGGRGFASLDLPFSDHDLTGLPVDLVRHFMVSFAAESRMNLHAKILAGSNDHHKAEALFKALGKVLDAASRIDPRRGGEMPTTKGVLRS